jgi:transposase
LARGDLARRRRNMATRTGDVWATRAVNAISDSARARNIWRGAIAESVPNQAAVPNRSVSTQLVLHSPYTGAMPPSVHALGDLRCDR